MAAWKQWGQRTSSEEQSKKARCTRAVSSLTVLFASYVFCMADVSTCARALWHNDMPKYYQQCDFRIACIRNTSRFCTCCSRCLDLAFLTSVLTSWLGVKRECLTWSWPTKQFSWWSGLRNEACHEKLHKRAATLGMCSGAPPDCSSFTPWKANCPDQCKW